MTITDNYRGPLSFKWFVDNEQKIDLSPENYQRCFVWDVHKQTELLRTIFDSNPGVVPEIHVRNFTTFINTTKRNGIIAELMDGQQRMTTMFRFLKNKLKTPKNLEFEMPDGTFINISDKFINELPQAAHSFFLEYKLQVAFYTDITDSDAADIFKNKLNSGKPLTKTEKRNAYNTEVARFIRNTARLGNGKIPRHDLFDTTLSSDGEIIFKNFDPKKFDYSEYDADELVAVISYMTWKGYSSLCTHDELDKMYSNKDFLDKFPHEKRVKFCLDILKSFVLSSTGMTSKTLWTISQMKHLIRLWMELDTKHQLKVDNYDKFLKMYLKTCLELYKPSNEEQANGKKHSYFKECVVRQKNVDGILYSISSVTKFILDDKPSWGIIDKNTEPREFTKESIILKLVAQDEICPMCNEKIAPEDAHGGHIVSFRDGGKTTQDNLVVLHAKCNMKLGTKEFKDSDYVKS